MSEDQEIDLLRDIVTQFRLYEDEIDDMNDVAAMVAYDRASKSAKQWEQRYGKWRGGHENETGNH